MADNRKPRWRRLVVVISLVMITGIIGWFAWPDMRPLLRSATLAMEAPDLVLGKNIQVSIDRAQVIHAGCTIDIDPTDSRRMFAASMVAYEPNGILGYYSHDGGETWALGFDGAGERRCDEAVAFGPDGTLHLAMMVKSTRAGKDADSVRYGIPGPPPGQQEACYDLAFHRSPHGGKAIIHHQQDDRMIDRPQLAIDKTHSSFRGTIYCNANEGFSWPITFRAANSRSDFIESKIPRKFPTAYPSRPVVLSDGAVVCCYKEIPKLSGLQDPPRLIVNRSADGGSTFEEVGQVPTAYQHPRFHSILNPTTVPYPVLAADSSSRFRDRIYCLWVDGPWRDRGAILFSSSSDRGRTWSAPVVLSEQPIDEPGKELWNADYPAIAVNRDGVVAVSWYDRRGRVQNEKMPLNQPPAPPIRGYDVRMRVSHDGGQTWSVSQLISEQPGVGELGEVRGWVDLAADAKGDFHPCWISDSGGVQQIWTTKVSIMR